MNQHTIIKNGDVAVELEDGTAWLWHFGRRVGRLFKVAAALGCSGSIKKACNDGISGGDGGKRTSTMVSVSKSIKAEGREHDNPLNEMGNETQRDGTR